MLETEWNDIEKDGDPGDSGSDEHYMVVLHGKFITIAYFFIDGFGHHWSSQWSVWDKAFNDGEVTHWAKMLKLPVV